MPDTIADLIDRWHDSNPGSGARLARALHVSGPVLDRRSVYSGEYWDDENYMVAWDASRAWDEFSGDIPSTKKLTKLWGIPRACDVREPEIVVES